MATPCELRLQTDDGALAQRMGDAAECEARRIERKFSRYRADSVVDTSPGFIKVGTKVFEDEHNLGTIDLATEKLDLSLRTQPTHFSIGSLPAPARSSLSFFTTSGRFFDDTYFRSGLPEES